MFVTALRLRYKRSVTSWRKIMKILSSLTLLLLLLLFALAWATWDMQRREAVAPPMDLAAFQPKVPAACSVCGGKRVIEVTSAPENCMPCKGTGHFQSELNSEICPFCKGTGKITKRKEIPCPSCGGATPSPAGKAAPAAFAHNAAVKLVVCPTCHGAKLARIVEPCRNCGGTGVYHDRAAFFVHGAACLFCKGSGKVEKNTNDFCPTCNGKGLVEQVVHTEPSTAEH